MSTCISKQSTPSAKPLPYLATYLYLTTPSHPLSWGLLDVVVLGTAGEELEAVDWDCGCWTWASGPSRESCRIDSACHHRRELCGTPTQRSDGLKETEMQSLALFPGSSAPKREIEFIHVERAWYKSQKKFSKWKPAHVHTLLHAYYAPSNTLPTAFHNHWWEWLGIPLVGA